MRELIEKLIDGKTLSRQESAKACELLCEADNFIQPAALLALMSARGETADELCGFIEVMKEAMIKVPFSGAAIDIVGTGGDGANTVNISTAASLVAASCGAVVIKHGNRASSSSCGSADFLEGCGVELYTKPEQALACIEKNNYVYLHKPAYHPIADRLKDLRKELQIRTIFNLLGPLLDPAEVKYLVLGVYTQDIMQLYADALIKENVEHAFVVHGNGLDELNCIGVNQVIEIQDGTQTYFELDPKEYGLKYCELADLKGGPPEYNVAVLCAVLKGEKPGAITDTIALNAGVALYTLGIADDIQSGINLALESIAVGKPFIKLQEVVGFFADA
jgi:anthranilate phosphoribosyltransferase